MNIGTKSVLFGAHQFLIHPLFVAAAWTKLYGFPKDPRLWVAFFVHDLGYIGKPNMDGPEGETHVEFGAKLMHRWFDRGVELRGYTKVDEVDNRLVSYCVTRNHSSWEWHDLSLYHSRFYAKKYGRSPSKLCIVDKLACCLEPWWLYIPRVILSGEVKEYMAMAKPDDGGKYGSMDISTSSIREWHKSMTDYMRRWVEEHKDGKDDTWTPAA